MRKTDINQYIGAPKAEPNKTGNEVVSTCSCFLRMALKAGFTMLMVLGVAGVVVLVAFISFVMSLKNESIKMDLSNLKLNYTSFIYVNDENGTPQEYQRLYSSENRIWVDYGEIPENMKDAIIAIEDKRFREHNGVDWRRTLGAVTTLFTKGGSYGGSTITQQLVKNITGDKEVSLTRKVKEIFRAINLDKAYSKDLILEAYLNVVNFGSGCQGVQAAANLYFNKDISECDLAECAAIAGITQNPYKYTPLIFPENNKGRQQTVLSEMLDQGLITESEYNTAMAKSEHMTFVGKTDDKVIDNVPVWNWYIDAMFEDVVSDLQEKLSISEEQAVNMMYHGGLKIYCAMDEKVQEIAEDTIADEEFMPKDQDLQLGYLMMDYNGRVLAIVGRRGERTGNRLLSYATDSQRQPGSTIKPISVYGPAIDMGVVNYSSILPDEPIDNWFGPGKPGPNNWYKNPPFYGEMTVQRALEISANAPAAQLCKMLSPTTCYNFLTEKLHFTHLNPKTDSVQIAAMAIGGMNGGVTVREMTAAFQIFGNGGKFNDPYTYYYVEDHDGNVILDNRSNTSVQALSSSTATIVHKLLRNVIYGSEGTGGRASIQGWEVFGKTGTTDDDKDSWFVGGTPYAVAGIWTGYETPSRIKETSWASRIWNKIMTQYLEDKEPLKFTYDSNVISATFCTETGKLAAADCSKTKTGWYVQGSLPGMCDGIHPGESSIAESGLVDPTVSGENGVSSEEAGSSGQSSSMFPWDPSYPSEPSSSTPASSADPVQSSSIPEQSSSEPVRPPWSEAPEENLPDFPGEITDKPYAEDYFYGDIYPVD